MLSDKDLRGVCEALLPIAGRILSVPVASPRSATPQEVCKAIGAVSPRQECIAVRDLPGAIRIAQSMERRTLITGSLFLVGEALAYFEKSGPPEASAQ
jgi:dihydrofolate synthase/folylpolyglutamate synthase